ncbi:MAG: hypothetical protein ACI32E_04070 [Bacilli bacterium]
MQRVVTEPLKVDLHIHSYYSKHKDDLSIVKESTEKNLHILVEKLNEYNVNMAAITDHDYFSYKMYKNFQSFEGTGSLKKVLPGVEFSVGIKNETEKVHNIHIVAIFDDHDEEKIKKIEEVLKVNNGKIDYQNGEKLFFTEEKFISILNKIGLNVILIAHQKNSVNSNTPSENDLMITGQKTFNEFLNSEVFEALEFKSMKNGLFNNLFAIKKNKIYDIVRFITGSDCHEWCAYPNHDSNSIDTDDFMHTYLKCLPTFKGLAMAITDYSRISLSETLFSLDSSKLNELCVTIDKNEYKIPLSNGINAIIGDNSIGKSLLIHKLTDYQYISAKNSIKTGYNEYLKNNKIDIKSKIDQKDIYQFDGQGSIRERFEQKDRIKNQQFLIEKFPEEPSPHSYLEIVNQQFNLLYKAISNKMLYDNEFKKLSMLLLQTEDIKAKNISINQLIFNKTKLDGINKVITYLEKINSCISNPEEYENNGLLGVDIENLKNYKNDILNMIIRYKELSNKYKKEYNIKTGINTGIRNFNEELRTYKNELENITDVFNTNVDDTANIISNLLVLKRNIKKFEFSIDDEVDVKPNSLIYDDYNFIKRFKNVQKINNEYLEDILCRVLKHNFKIDTSKITESDLNDNIKDNSQSLAGNPLKLLKEKVQEIVNEDFEIESVILKAGQNEFDNLSNGLNATLYFDIISSDGKKGIYIIDQPEDDVSQKAIKDRLVSDFKTMSKHRQIILITHNPQFVVNLDVDNVICIEKSVDGKIEINYGALEYEDLSTNIINKVAINLDGGVESIKKRWKRYEKEFEIN